MDLQQEQPDRKRLISIIIPSYNESSNIAECLGAVIEVMERSEEEFEIIPVNDGSKDSTIDILLSYSKCDARVMPVDLKRNYGQTTAYQAGIDAAGGTHIIFFSGDLEIPAVEILKVVERLDKGYHFVNTARENRWGGSHALKSKVANKILNLLTDTNLTDRGSGLKGMSGEIARSLTLYGEWHRFLPDLASIHTSRIDEFAVPFEERKAGVSSYRGKIKSLTVFLDLATVTFTVHAKRKPFNMLPGRLFGFTGLLIGSVGICISIWLTCMKLFLAQPLGDRPLFLVGIMLSLLGLNMAMVGILGELIMQISTKLDRIQANHYLKN
ncbi:MAG: glycosyltransferase [Coraliomargarita sp.]